MGVGGSFCNDCLAGVEHTHAGGLHVDAQPGHAFSDDFDRSSLGPAWGGDDGVPVTSGMPLPRSTMRPEGGPDASQREAMARVLGSVTARGGDGPSAHGELAAHVERLLRDPAVIESLSADQLRKVIAAIDAEFE